MRADTLKSDLCASITCGRFRNDISETYCSFHLRPLAIADVQFHCTGCTRIFLPATEVSACACFATSDDCHMSKFTGYVGASSSSKYFTPKYQAHSNASSSPDDNKIAGRSYCPFLPTSLRFINRSRRCVVLYEDRHLKIQHLYNWKVAPSK